MEHRPPSHDIIHAPSLEQIGFEEYEPPEGFCPLWRSYRGEGETSGSFHILAPSDRWQIAIHDFTLLHDTVMEFELPEYLSVAWYESISGEEFTPYRRLRAKSIWGFYSGDGGWRGLVHGGVPVRPCPSRCGPRCRARTWSASTTGSSSACATRSPR